MADSKQGEAKLARILAPLPETERGKGIQIYAHPKGDRYIYTNGRSVILRSFSDPAVADVFSEHKAKVNVAAFSANGNYVASGDSEGYVIVWETANKKIKNKVAVCRSVLDVSWSPDGTKIVAVGDGTSDRARVFTWDSGNNVGEIIGHSKPILSCSYRPDRPFRIATASEDLGVNFYEGPPFKLSSRNESHTRYPNAVRFSPNGSQFVSVGSDSKIIVYDGKTGEKVKVLESKEKKENHQGAIYAFAWSPDSKQILTSSADKTAKIWNVEEGTLVHTFTFADKPQVTDMQVGALWSGDNILTVSLSGAINYLDIQNPKQPKQIIHGHMMGSANIALDVPSGVFYVSDLTGNIVRWDFKSGASKWLEGKGHEKVISGVVAYPEGVTSIGFDDNLRVNSGSAFGSDSVSLGGQPVAIAAASKTSQLVAVILAQQKLVLIRGNKIVFKGDLSFAPLCLQFSLDDSQLVIGGKDSHLHFFSVNNDVAEEIKEKACKLAGAVSSIRFSPDGQFITTVDKSRTIGFWDSKGENVNTAGWRFHNATVTDSAWSPNGTRFATCSLDEGILVWSDFKNFEPVRIKIEGAHTQGVSCVRFWDENTLISVGDDRSIKIWDLPQ